MSAKEVYLISGGRPGNMRQISEDFRAAFAACGKPNPKVAYVGTASGDSKTFFQAMKIPMTRAGAETVALAPIARKNADVGKAKSILSEADVVFLSGGEVEDGIVWLERYGLDSFLTDLYRGGKLFMGMSAGAIMLGQVWVHWDVEGDDSTSRPFACLNLVPFIFDTHAEKEDWTELKCALRLTGAGTKGHGLSSGGFYSADESGKFTCYRNDPVLFLNVGGKIERIAEDG